MRWAAPSSPGARPRSERPSCAPAASRGARRHRRRAQPRSATPDLRDRCKRAGADDPVLRAPSPGRRALRARRRHGRDPTHVSRDPRPHPHGWRTAMSLRLRIALFALAQLCLLPAIWKIAQALPPFGTPSEIYGRSVDALGPPLRQISNMVSAVNFDFRGLDTLGEEFMLLCAVTGAVTLLRGLRGEDRGAKAVRLS